MDVLLKIRKFLMFKLITRRILPDKIYYQYCYFILFGKTMSYKNPVGFNAKIQWLKVYRRDPVLITLADKVEARNYVKNKIGEKYLVPEFGVYSKINELNWNNLPDKFIIKANHGSGWNLICKNKNNINRKKATKQFRKWLKTNFYWQDKEWQYRQMKPRLICEKYLDETKGELIDIKLFCYNGKPEFIVIYPAGNKYRNIYYTNWERVKGKTSYKQGPDMEKPPELDLITELASKLSTGFPFVRVDFLLQNGKIYFGELTFTPAGGFYRFKPRNLDMVFGKPLVLPEL